MIQVSEELRAFVRRLCMKQLTDKQVLAVAQGCRWNGMKAEIREVLAARGDRWRKISE